MLREMLGTDEAILSCNGVKNGIEIQSGVLWQLGANVPWSLESVSHWSLFRRKWRAPQSKLHTIISRHLNFCERGTLHRVNQSKLHTIISRHLNFCERKTQCVCESVAATRIMGRLINVWSRWFEHRIRNPEATRLFAILKVLVRIFFPVWT